LRAERTGLFHPSGAGTGGEEMNSQDKKHWLSRYQSINRQVKSKLDEIERLRSLETKITPTLSDMPKGGSSNKIEIVTERIDEIERQMSDELKNLVDTRAEIEAAIQAIPETHYRELLERRYIYGERWEQIAVDMNYNYRTVFKVHGYALGKLQIPEKEGSKGHYEVC
jgi:DNA-directed RNA polymerase specialized sigma24 family protein